jgi:cold shock CspA family protein
MAKSKETFNKREKEKQRQKEKREKREKMEERRANQPKGRSLDDMLAYIDEDGNITSTPPDPAKMKKVINAEDIEIGVPKRNDSEDPLKEGKVDYFNGSKGFGFIIQSDGTKVFFHINQTTYPVKEGDLVTFMVERGPKGWNAVDVTKKA